MKYIALISLVLGFNLSACASHQAVKPQVHTTCGTSEVCHDGHHHHNSRRHHEKAPHQHEE
ncbi:MAG: hypothetical protein Q9M10_04420 [Mariprofundaceae bacterium]|nr:hypothetical protein [Mariprofundaceae bacterium]